MYDKEDSNYKGDYFKSPFFYALLAFVVGVMLGRFINFPINDESQPVETDHTISSDTFTVAPEDKIEKNTKIRKAIVVSETGCVLRGGRYMAQIYLAEIDTSLKYTVFVKDRPLERNIYSFVCASIGKNEYQGHIEVEESDGTISKFPFSNNFMVINPIANISTDILYAGKENSIEITVSGLPYEDIAVVCTNSTMKKVSKTHYIIKPTLPGRNCDLSVSVKAENKVKIIGRKVFRVEKWPISK